MKLRLVVALLAMLAIHGIFAALPDECGTVGPEVTEDIDNVLTKVEKVKEYLANSKEKIERRIKQAEQDPVDTDDSSTDEDTDSASSDSSDGDSDSRRKRATDVTPSDDEQQALDEINAKCGKVHDYLEEGYSIGEKIKDKMEGMKEAIGKFFDKIEEKLLGSETGKKVLDKVNEFADKAKNFFEDSKVGGFLGDLFGRRRKRDIADDIDGFISGLTDSSIAADAKKLLMGDSEAKEFYAVMCRMDKDKVKLLAEDENIVELWKTNRIANAEAIESVVASVDKGLPCGVDYCEALACTQSIRARLEELRGPVQKIFGDMKEINSNSKAYLEKLKEAKEAEEADEDQEVEDADGDQAEEEDNSRRRKRALDTEQTLASAASAADDEASELETNAAEMDEASEEMDDTSADMAEEAGVPPVEEDDDDTKTGDGGAGADGDDSNKENEGENGSGRSGLSLAIIAMSTLICIMAKIIA